MPIKLKVVGIMKESNIRIESCSELQDYTSTLGYMNHIATPKKIKKRLHKEIGLQIPRKINPHEDKSVMIVKIGNHYKRIIGQYGPLMALFILARQYQTGTLHCRYCRRIIPDQCQIPAFLNFLVNC